MGICLALFQVDHEHIVARGLPVLNRALQTGDPVPLRELLNGLPFDESEQLAESFRQRVTRLREVGAPPLFIEAEERRLASVRRPVPHTLERASLEELRLMLGGWCREARTIDLDKAWDLIHWYCDAGRRRRAEGDWRAQPPGFLPSPFDYAVHGQESYPRDASGQPVIRTGGSPEMSWYNPPGTVADIAAAVSQVSLEWEPTDTDVEAAPAEHRPYLADSAEHLEYVHEAFGRLAHCYQAAAGRGFGVSVEFY